MDGIKDIQKTESISDILDTHRVRTNPFGANKGAERVYRRAERIATALYMLTNHIRPEEPVRNAVRTSASDLLQAALSLRDELRSVHSLPLVILQSKIRYIISLIRLMSVSGTISFQNAAVVMGALDELGIFLSVLQRSPISENIAVSKEDLGEAYAGQSDMAAPRPKRGMSDRSILKDKTFILDKIDMSDKEKHVSDNVHVRVQSILEVLRSGTSFAIKDVLAQLPEYSEKMIQRGLGELVEAGKVKKTGLKRWSRYAIVAQ